MIRDHLTQDLTNSIPRSISLNLNRIFWVKIPKNRSLSKVFHRYIKAFLAARVRKSVLELTFAKLVFGKSDFLDLVDFDFLDLADFAAVDRFSKLPPTPSLSALLAALGASSFSAWVIWVSSSVDSLVV